MICVNVPSYQKIQLSGHKRVDSIEDYHKIASIKHQEEMSRIILVSYYTARILAVFVGLHPLWTQESTR